MNYNITALFFCLDEFCKTLFQRGLKLITGIRRNMKNYLMPLIERILLRKRFLVERLFDILKIHINLSHTRHRSSTNACVNILSCLSAYQLIENKPSMKFYSLPLIQNWGFLYHKTPQGAANTKKPLAILSQKA